MNFLKIYCLDFKKYAKALQNILYYVNKIHYIC